MTGTVGLDAVIVDATGGGTVRSWMRRRRVFLVAVGTFTALMLLEVCVLVQALDDVAKTMPPLTSYERAQQFPRLTTSAKDAWFPAQRDTFPIPVGMNDTEGTRWYRHGRLKRVSGDLLFVPRAWDETATGFDVGTATEFSMSSERFDVAWSWPDGLGTMHPWSVNKLSDGQPVNDAIIMRASFRPDPMGSLSHTGSPETAVRLFMEEHAGTGKPFTLLVEPSEYMNYQDNVLVISKGIDKADGQVDREVSLISRRGAFSVLDCPAHDPASGSGHGRCRMDMRFKGMHVVLSYDRDAAGRMTIEKALQAMEWAYAKMHIAG